MSDKNSIKNKSNNLNLKNINNEEKSQSQSINISGKSENEKKSEEEKVLFKKSNSYNLAEGVTFFKINNFNDKNINNNDALKKSKTFREENIYGLNIPYRLNNGQNHLATVLETINEVSNSRVDSSELSDDENKNENNNDNKNKNNNININNIVKSNENNQINDSCNTAAATKNSLKFRKST